MTADTKAAKRFLGKALKELKDWEQPEVLNTDKAPTYAVAIAALKAEGKCPEETRHRQVKYLNNVVEADHGKLKLLIRPVRDAALRRFEALRPPYPRRRCPDRGSHRPRPKRRTIVVGNTRPSPRDSHKSGSGIPGAVQEGACGYAWVIGEEATGKHE